jgi:hypothetical protein
MARGWADTDPDKGLPHRHIRARIRLMLNPLPPSYLMEEIILRVAAKRPEEVLDAVREVLGGE